MTHRVVYSRPARKQIMSLPSSAARRLYTRIGGLATTPRPRGAQKLKGEGELYRIRVGDYRVVYEIEDDRLVILIVRIAKRSESTYRRLT